MKKFLGYELVKSENGPRFRYVIHVDRYIASPQYGPRAYYNDFRYIVIPFGKGQIFETGKDAREEAYRVASAIRDHSSNVEFYKMNGGSGIGTVAKRDPESRLVQTWDDLPEEPCQ